MTSSEFPPAQQSARRTWKPGVRARLLLAFFGIAAFAVLAAAAAIYAFYEIGNRLAVIDARVPPALSALELSRSAERIIAAAPALLAATDRSRRDQVKAELAAEVERLNARLLDLQADDAKPLPLSGIEPTVAALTDRLASLDERVGQRLATGERIANLRREAFRTNDETQRLLAPWLDVTGREIARQVEALGVPGEPSRELAELIVLQQRLRDARTGVSAVADLLAEASTTGQSRRLEILAFQLDLALDDLEATAVGFDPRLRALFLEQLAKLRGFATGSDAVTAARQRELALVEEGETRLAEAGRLSARLTAVVDELSDAAGRDVGTAIGNARDVQQMGTRALIVVAGLSLLTSVLIVWLYVGRNIARRLGALSDDTLAIAGGSLHTPVTVAGNDEIAAMGRAIEVFRRNAIELQNLLEARRQTATRLEQQVAERTRDLSDKSHQLEIANRFKSHFLASASHDLRQPLHALNLFVAQLQTEADAAERRRLVERIEAAVSAMNELFESLLDMAKLEAGILEPHLTEFPIEQAFKRIETTFADAARQKGLRLSVVPSRLRVRSDFVLLERILFNLVSNAVRYTARGGVVVGARCKGEQLRIDVCDTGPGIPQDQRRKVFDEFHQLTESDRHGGLGLGLAIVERLGGLLNHEVELDSRPGHGSRFSVSVPRAAERCSTAETPVSPPIVDPARDKLVVVIDDDPLVLEGMGGILRSWGCRVLVTDSEEAVLPRIAAHRPDLIIADYRLADGHTGIQAIKRLRERLGAAIPAFLISGDTAPERLRDASEQGFQLLHKPVAPMRLRAMLNRLLKAREATRT